MEVVSVRATACGNEGANMSHRIMGLWALVSVACTTPAQFDDAYGPAYCDSNNACRQAGGLEPLDCAEAMGRAPDTCDYDRRAAQACLMELDEAVCDEALHYLIPPDVCAQVYACEEL